MALQSIPTNFGTGGSGLAPKNSGTPTLRDLLEEHRAAIAVLQGATANVVARFATTANITLASTALTAIDGVTPVAGDIALVKDQSAPGENGLYLASASAWTRLKDATGGDVIKAGLKVTVAEGTVNADTFWELTTNAPITVGSTSLAFALYADDTGDDGRLVANTADDAVIGGIEVVHVIAIADGVTADKDVVFTHKTEILQIEVIKGANAGGASDTIQVKKGATAITDAMSINVAAKIVVRPSTVDMAQTVIAAGGTLRVTKTKASGADVACRVIVRGVRRA